jgi:hypothetical protein
MATSGTVVGAVLLVAAAGALGAGILVPDPKLVAFSMPYSGKGVGPFPFRIPKNGHYRVGLRMASDEGLVKQMDRSEPPINVVVTTGDSVVGESNSESEFGTDVFWGAYQFTGLKGETANIRVQPGMSWKLVSNRKPLLQVARIQDEEGRYFTLTSGLRIGAAILFVAGSLMLLSARRRH